MFIASTDLMHGTNVITQSGAHCTLFYPQQCIVQRSNDLSQVRYIICKYPHPVSGASLDGSEESTVKSDWRLVVLM